MFKPFAVFVSGCLLLLACQTRKPIPFPADQKDFANPVAEPIKFTAPVPLHWPDKAIAVTSTPVAFNLNHLPEADFDSLGFRPFPVAPEEVSLAFDLLPSGNFDLEKIPAVPARFSVQPLAAAKIIRVGKTTLRSNRDDIIMDFPEPLNGTPIQFITRSKYGFIWIATPNSLFRYDGENLYQQDIAAYTDAISNMLEDHAGRLWITSRTAGIIVIDLKQGQVFQLSAKQGLRPSICLRPFEDSKRRMWVSFLSEAHEWEREKGGGFLLLIDSARQTMRILTKKEGLNSDEPVHVTEDGNHLLFISTAHRGLNIIDESQRKIRFLTKAQGLMTDTLASMVTDISGRVWVCNLGGGGIVVDVNRKKMTNLGPAQGFAYTFSSKSGRDTAGNVYLFNERTAYVVDSSVRKMKKIDRRLGLASAGWGAIAVDNRNQLWLGNAAGMNQFNKGQAGLRRVSNFQVSSMLDDDRGHVWVGTTETGIQIVDTATGKVRLYDQAHGLSDNYIQYMIKYDGKVLLSTQRGGLEIIDSTLQRIERIGVAQGVGANLIAIESDENKNIWLAGEANGLDVLDIHTRKLRHIGQQQELGREDIIELRSDHKDKLWFYSFTVGLGVIDTRTNSIRNIDSTKYKSLTGGRENNLILIDKKGYTWLMSSASGVYIFNPAMDSVIRINTKNGLYSNWCHSILEHDGKIYVANAGGLNLITAPWSSGSGWEITGIDRTLGLTKTVNTYSSNLILKNGNYWWGDDGITMIGNVPGKLRKITTPPTHITGFDVLNETLFFSDSAKDKNGMTWDSLVIPYFLPVNLSLPHDANFIRFRFAQMHMGAADTVWYRYYLEGVDQQWSQKVNQPFSENYPNLSPGKYTFHVASQFRGSWCDPVSFTFTVRGPWWSQWWAWLGYLLGTLAVLRAYIVYRSRKLLRENKLLEEKIDLRTRQLQESLEDLKATQSQLIQSEKMASLGELTAGIAHEIQNPLNFINNFAEVNKELLTDMKEELAAGNTEAVDGLVNDIIANEEKINHHGKRADGIVKSMLQHSRSRNQTVKQPADLNKLADEYLRLAYHGLRAKDKSFNATLKTDFDPAVGEVNMVANDVGRVMLNLITNAFYAVGEKAVHQKAAGIAFDPKVTVSTRRVGGSVVVVVSDNGNGIPQRVLDKIFQPFFTTKPSGQGTGLGLSLAYDIVKAHGGELNVETNENEGTTFFLKLPIT